MGADVAPLRLAIPVPGAQLPGQRFSPTPVQSCPQNPTSLPGPLWLALISSPLALCGAAAPASQAPFVSRVEISELWVFISN